MHHPISQPFDSDPEPRKPWWHWIKTKRVLFISVAIHLLFGVAATYYVVQQVQLKRRLSFVGGPPSPNPSQRALEHQVSMDRKKNMMSAPAQAKRIMTTGLASVALPDMPSTATSSNVLANRMSGLGGPLQGFGSGGAGGGGMGSGGSGVNFFGLRAKVKAIVFVIDISGSMVLGKKSPETYKELENEVAKVINGLDPEAKFGVVAFSKAADSYRTELVEARPDEKEKAIHWLKSMSPGDVLEENKGEKSIFKNYKNGRHDGTRADLGLQRAFRMKPDTIFFVSDGEPSEVKAPEVLHQVEEHQKNMPHPVIVNSVAYMADNGQKFMRDLAEQNKGTFREVNPGETGHHHEEKKKK